MKIERKNTTLLVTEVGDHSKRDAKKLYHKLRVKLRTHPTLKGTHDYIELDGKTIVIPCNNTVAAVMGKRVFLKILKKLE